MAHERQGRGLAVATVAQTATLRDAMTALDRSTYEIALVVDEGGRLVGTMTDGDVRRALLHGAPLDAGVVPHMQRNFTAVDPRANRAEVLDLMQARGISQIPVLDAGGQLVGLHLLRDVIGPVERPNWAVIMVGGRGSRLAPLTDDVPKPMLRVAGRPILERIVLHLVGHGIRRIFLAINYLGHVIEAHFGNGEQFGARIEYLREQRPLGTGGSLSLLPERPTEPVLVMNGDLVTQLDMGRLFAFHESGGQAVSVAVRKYFHTVPFGCVELDGDRLIGLEEKPTLTRLVNAGIYVLAPGIVASMPRGEPTSLPEVVSGAMARNEVVRVFEIDEDWIDVGQREQLRQARGETD
jgi:dTDP-glucose pyrophosphorylase/CBS domain-containing protein